MGLQPFRGRERHRERPAYSGAGDLAGTLFDRAVTPRSKQHATPASSEAASLAWLRSKAAAQTLLQLYGTGERLAAHQACDRIRIGRQRGRPRVSDMTRWGWLAPVEPRETRETGDGGKGEVLEVTDAGRALLRLLTSGPADAT